MKARTTRFEPPTFCAECGEVLYLVPFSYHNIKIGLVLFSHCQLLCPGVFCF